MTEVPAPHKATIDIAMAVAELPALLDSIPGMAWLADADGSRTYVAPAWLDFTGRREADELGEGWADSLPPEDRERCLQIVRAALRSRQVFSIEYRCLRHDGEYRWVLDTGVPRFGPRDELEGYVGSRVDITKRKQAEASLARAQTELEALSGSRQGHAGVERSAVSSEVNERRRVEESERESESEWKFQQLATNIREVFWIAEAGKGLHYLSPAYEEIWGRPIAAAYGIPGGWLRWVHPEDRERVKDALEQWWDGEFAEVEYRISRPDGTEKWIWDRGYPVSASAGEPRLITGIAEDITERKHRELALQLTQTSVDRAAYAVYWIDAADARLVYVNDAAVSALGYTSDELEQMTLFDFVTHLDEERFATYMDGLRREPHLVIESEHRRKDGTTFPTEVSVNYMRFGNTEYLCSFAQDITERKRADAAIRESEWRFRQLATNIREIFWMAEPGQRVLYVSPSYEEVTGRSCDSLYADPTSWLEAIHPDDRERATGAMQRQIAGEYTEEEYRIRKPDGSIRWIRDRGFPIAERASTRQVFTGIAEDITERKRREQALELTQFSVDRAAVGILWIDEDGRIAYVNEAVRGIVGYTREEVISMTIHDLDPAFPVGVWKEFWEQLKEAGPLVFETDALRKDGSLLPIEVSANYLEVEGRGVCCAFASNITKRKQYEGALLASERRFRSLVQTAGSVIIWLSPDFTILEWNREAEELYQTPRNEAIGQNYFERFLSDADREAVIREKDAVLAGRETCEFASRVKRPDGSTRSVSWKVTPLYDADGRPEGLIATGHDVTEREETEREQIVQFTRAQHLEKLESLGVLAGGIAHDFNNLLMAMLGHAELALMELPAGSPTADDLRQISTAARRAAELTKQMLAFAGKGNLVTEPVAMTRVVDDMADLLDASVPENVRLEFALTENLSLIEADPVQIQQLLRNLVTNAYESIGEEAGTITVRVGTERFRPEKNYVGGVPRGGKMVMLQVEDTGGGMDAETQQKIFDPFFSTKFAGRGLGLAAVLGIARAHSGSILVDSEPGRGTTISILFPAAPDRVHEQLVTEGEWNGRGTVLVVDDEPPVLSLTSRILERHGLSVLTAVDGRIATKVFREHRDEIDVVVLDLTMPGLGGEATLRALRVLRPDVKVIVASGFSAEDVAERFTDDGPSGFLQKPYTPDELMERVSEVLSRDPVRV